MKTKHNKPSPSRLLLLLIPLFAAAALAMLGLVYPALIEGALDACCTSAPLGNPTVTVTADDGTSLYTDDQTLSRLSEIGTVTQITRLDTVTADGIRIRLLSAGSAVSNAVVLTEGRMPQNDAECVIVPVGSAAGKTVGAVIRPCGSHGEVLTDENGTPCALTVVGIGENILSVLSPIADNDTQLLVYTTSDRPWQNSDAVSVLYLTDCQADDPTDAVRSVYAATAQARTASRTALAGEQLQAYLIAADKADDAVTAQEITVQATENRLDTANLRVAEIETNMMDAIAALQAEKQQFVSDMEYNEYYALRQVDLIPRRDRAEEGYAKQESVIEQMNTDLHAAYADRDAIQTELQRAKAILAELNLASEAALAALQNQQALAAQNENPQIWHITEADVHPGYTALFAHAADIRSTAFLLCALCIGIYLVGSLTVYAVRRRAALSPIRFWLASVLITVPAILIGGAVPARPVFAYHYPALRTSLTLPALTAEALPAALAVLIAAAVAAAVVCIIGLRLCRSAQQAKAK